MNVQLFTIMLLAVGCAAMVTWTVLRLAVSVISYVFDAFDL